MPNIKNLVGGDGPTTVSRYPFNLHPKVILAFFFPLISAVLSSLGSWVISGDFNESEIRTAVGGTIASALALLGGWLGQPAESEAVVGPANDDLMSDEAKRQLGR